MSGPVIFIITRQQLLAKTYPGPGGTGVQDTNDQAPVTLRSKIKEEFTRYSSILEDNTVI